MGKVKFAAAVFALAVLLFPAKVQANEILNVKATAYCYNSGHTATGTVPVEGRTLAGKREWFGKTALLYEDLGEGIQPQNFIGCYQVEDTGGKPIRDGYVVDVFIKDYNRAIEFGCKRVILILIDAEG